ncbi:MAG: helix-turn-helix transcriptional regulator [Lachnospiraceae bacterium]|nr:helix-turn-helix transcriptional regulator [Lachnospiraceae bacterium]
MKLCDDLYNDVFIFVLEAYKKNEFRCVQMNEKASSFFNLPYPLSKSYDLSDHLQVANCSDFLSHCNLALKENGIHRFSFRCQHQEKEHLFITTLSRFTYENQTYLYAVCISAPFNPGVYEHQLRMDLKTLLVKTDSMDCAFEIIRNNDHYELFSFSQFFSQFFQLDNGCLDMNLRFHLSEQTVRFIEQAAEECLKYGYYATDILSDKVNGKDAYFKMTFTPLTHGGITTILCYVLDCTKDILTFNQFDESKQIMDFLFYTSCNACCLCDVQDETNPIVLRQNASMQAFKSYHSTSLIHETLYEKYKILSFYKVPLSFFISLKNNDDMQDNHYQMYMVPFFKDSSIYRIFLSIKKLDKLEIQMQNVDVHLTKRETEVLSYVINGNKNSYIAAHLGISEGTVKRILSNTYSKLNVTSRTELMKYYFDIARAET